MEPIILHVVSRPLGNFMHLAGENSHQGIKEANLVLPFVACALATKPPFEANLKPKLV